MIYPISEHYRRQRIQRRQSEDEPGWDAPIPADDHRRIIPFNDSRNNLPKRDQPTTTNAAKLPVVVLLMSPHVDYLSDDPLVHTQNLQRVENASPCPRGTSE
jgi:hypothetical protein